MSRKKRTPRTRKTGRLVAVVVVIVVGIVILGGLAVLFQRPTGDAIARLRDSDSAFSVPTHVGQPAPKFTAINVDGQPYTVTPGDGRPKVLVFYMGLG
jgi:cytochrome oxidase Cu insertion factor (SCO1/SenC/PrrC family)